MHEMHEPHDTDDLFFPTDQPGVEEDDPEVPQPMRFIDIHVYDLPSEEEEPPSVESDLASEQSGPEAPEAPASRRRYLVPFLVGVLCVLIIGALGMVYVLPLFTPSTATITIVPISQQVRTTATTLTVTTGPTTSGTIPGRVLPAVTMSQQQTVPTTGTAHQPAQAAHGSVTFYNAATYAQAISAGTLLTGADGVQIVTAQSVTVPAALYPTFGQASIIAQATSAGPAGNIKAGDIYGPCCMINISAVNEPFTGGIEARNYQMVTPQNIESVTANIKASLGKSEQAALQTQVRQGETLISPLPCQQTVTPNHHPGEEAAQVQVTVSETCTGTVYITQSYQEKIAQIINQQANTQLGTGYQETGAVQESITHVTPKDKQQTAIQVNLAGTYAYQFTQEQQQTISALVKGKSKAQATTALLQDPDVQSVSISIDKGTTIPTQSNAIRLIILPVG